MKLTKYLLLLVQCGIFTASIANAQTIAGDEYSQLGYDEPATQNPVAKLAARIQDGAVQLQYEENRGYFDSLLENLGIDPASQVLVFSKTSLQHKLISATAPRALYFSEKTYIGWVQGSDIVEIVTTDDELGLVFYIFNNTHDPKQAFEREGQSCLVCHDSAGTMGGGVPLLMSLSSVYSTTGANLLEVINDYYITDDVPLRDRWGGWYVTGQHGKQPHLGNIQLEGSEQLKQLDTARLGNIDTLEGLGFFDTSPFPATTSDIVALMILEHQASVQNQLTYIKFKAPAIIKRLGFTDIPASTSWDSLPDKAKRILTRMLDKLLQRMLMLDATEFTDPISGSPTFAAWFAAQSIADEQGRSLWDLDLKTQLFKYPMSFIIYSSNFDTLPFYAKDYLYNRLAEILEGRDSSETYAQLSQGERRDILEILRSTKADFATQYLTVE